MIFWCKCDASWWQSARAAVESPVAALQWLCSTCNGRRVVGASRRAPMMRRGTSVHSAACMTVRSADAPVRPTDLPHQCAVAEVRCAVVGAGSTRTFDPVNGSPRHGARTSRDSVRLAAYGRRTSGPRARTPLHGPRRQAIRSPVTAARRARTHDRVDGRRCTVSGRHWHAAGRRVHGQRSALHGPRSALYGQRSALQGRRAALHDRRTALLDREHGLARSADVTTWGVAARACSPARMRRRVAAAASRRAAFRRSAVRPAGRAR